MCFDGMPYQIGIRMKMLGEIHLRKKKQGLFVSHFSQIAYIYKQEKKDLHYNVLCSIQTAILKMFTIMNITLKILAVRIYIDEFYHKCRGTKC